MKVKDFFPSMKSTASIVLMIVLCSLFTNCKNDIDEAILNMDNFKATENLYEYSCDWDEEILKEFGSEYRVADWNDLLEFYDKGGDLLSLFDHIGITEWNTNIMVTFNGVRTYSSTRYYYATRHEHNKPSAYLAHENIDNYLVSLGSWTGTRKIMAIRENLQLK